jgi:hypothetical protein
VTVKSLSASVQARLQNHARATKRPFQELMLYVWDAPLARATKDIDFLGRMDNSLENLERVVREVCATEVEPDGMVFDPATVKTERIKEDADYEGVRVRFVGLLGKARVAMQIDVGFGDVVTPGAESITYPALLDLPAPELSGVPASSRPRLRQRRKLRAALVTGRPVGHRLVGLTLAPARRSRRRAGPRRACPSAGDEFLPRFIAV